MIAQECGWAWEVLGIDVSADQREIKRAYSRLLKLNRPDDDPEAFQHLHQAYQAALAYARYNAEPAEAESPVREPSMPESAVMRRVDFAPAQADPLDEAHAQWRAFLAQSAYAPRAQLQAIFQSDAMLGFSTRDAFELIALRHCADPECDETLRGALVEHFDWAQDASHVVKHDPAAAQDAVGRYQATNSLDQLRRDYADDSTIDFLLAGSIPENLGRTGDKTFIQQMKARIEYIRWHHPDLLTYRIDPDVFAWWEQKVETKRYFVQTAMWSLAIGVVGFFVARSLLDLDDPAWAIGALFFGCQAISFGTIALIVLRPPQGFYAALARFKVNRIDAWLHEKRYQNRWQFGWLAPFAGLSLLMLVPDPGIAARVGVASGLFLCAAASVFAGSLFLGIGRVLLALALALANAFAMHAAGFESAGFASCLFFSVSLFVLLMQHGYHLYSTARISLDTLTGARVVWMAAAVALYFSIDFLQLSVLSTAAAAMLLLLCGVILSRFVTANYLLGFPALFFFFKSRILRPSALSGELRESQLEYLGPVLIIMFVLTIMNIFQSFSEAE